MPVRAVRERELFKGNKYEPLLRLLRCWHAVGDHGKRVGVPAFLAPSFSSSVDFWRMCLSCRTFILCGLFVVSLSPFWPCIFGVTLFYISLHYSCMQHTRVSTGYSYY